MIEGPFLPYQGMHTAYAGGGVGVLNVQFAVGGKLAFVAMWAQIPGAGKLCLSQGRQNAPRSQFAVTCLLTTGTWDGALFGCGLGELQQFTQSCCPGLVEGGTESHFHRFQIRSAGLLPLGKDAAE